MSVVMDQDSFDLHYGVDFPWNAGDNARRRKDFGKERFSGKPAYYPVDALFKVAPERAND